MTWIHHLQIALLLSLCVTTFSFPHQLVFRPNSSPGDVKVTASGLRKGDDATLLFNTFIRELDQGVPSGWERIVQPADTAGSSAVEVIDPVNLDQAFGNWGIHESIRGQALEDIRLLIDIHADEAVYVGQKFNYNVPGCRGGELPVCLHTLLVIVRQLDLSEEMSAVELSHYYIETYSSAIQQYDQGETCHFCWFSKCCHTVYSPRPLSAEEQLSVQAFLSTNQARWADANPPKHALSNIALNEPFLQEVLHKFVNNDVENKDVFRENDDTMISTLQGAMRSSQRKSRSFSMTFREQNLGILDNILSPCLKKANVVESAQDIFRRAQDGFPDRPFSLECQVVSKKQVQDDPPSEGCTESSVLNVNTKYSWVLLSPRLGQIDCVFIGSEIEASHESCVPKPEDPNHDDDNDEGSIPWFSQHHCNDETPELAEEGAIVRWSVPNAEGSFSIANYIVQWTAYSRKQNKALMDILRYASATAFLKIPIIQARLSSIATLDGDPQPGDGKPVPVPGNPLKELGDGLGAIGEGWSKLSKALANRVTETVRREVCLGFEKYEHTVTALAAQGIEQENFIKVVEALIDRAKPRVPDIQDMKDAMVVLKYSDNITWTGEMASYSSEDGFLRFFYFYKYANVVTKKVDIVFGTLNSTFKLAPDVLVINRKSVKWFGLDRSEEVIFRNVPHILTVNDTALLTTYFEVVAYRKLALVVGAPEPSYPSMGPVCPRY